MSGTTERSRLRKAATIANDATQIQNKGYATVTLEPGAPTPAQQRNEAIKQEIRDEIA